jgi:hypothetical protein
MNTIPGVDVHRLAPLALKRHGVGHALLNVRQGHVQVAHLQQDLMMTQAMTIV